MTTTNDETVTAEAGASGEESKPVLFRLREDYRSPTMVRAGLFTGPDEEHLARRGTLNIPVAHFDAMDVALRCIAATEDTDRRLAAVLARTGPMWLTGGEVNAADPDLLVELHSLPPHEEGKPGIMVGLAPQFNEHAEPVAGPLARVTEVFDRAGMSCPQDVVADDLREIADKAAGTLNQLDEARLRDMPGPDMTQVLCTELLRVTSALLAALGYESTPVATEVYTRWRADNDQMIRDLIAAEEARLRAEDAPPAETVV